MSPRPVAPRAAASVVLIRESREGPEILMGRRAAKHRFMPNVFVFPGGRVDRDDPLRPAASELRPEVRRQLEKSASARLARGLAIAGLRETQEETGLGLGRMDAAGRLLPDLSRLDYLARAITPPPRPMRFHARFFLADAGAARGKLGGSGELLDLDFYPLARALKLPIADITEFILGLLAAERHSDRTPRWSYRRERRLIRLE